MYKNRHYKMPSGALTDPKVLIRLLTPTQDLVFAPSAIRGHAVGGGFRDLTVLKAAGTRSGSAAR